jgi:murein DD-endopeptidase MepM/ murein hydrolase activator NlpD
MYISPANLLVGCVGFVLVMLVAVALLVAYTPVMDTIPGYPGGRSRETLLRGIMRLDSLERQMGYMTVYSNNIEMIMEGKTPVIRDVTRVGDSVRVQEKSTVPANAADSVLRARMEGSGPLSLAASAASQRSSEGAVPLMVPPVKGEVSVGFDPVKGSYGVEIATADQSPVVAAMDGTVILNVLVPGEGRIVQLQHTGNLVSAYRRLSEASPSVGSRLKAGEIVGTAGPLAFELWYDGRPVDPLNYIIF